MQTALSVPFIAPIPVGHRVQILRANRWQSPLFGGQPSWTPVAIPVLVDVDTGIVYASALMSRDMVASPLGFQPNKGYQVANVTEGRVTSCLVASCGGDTADFSTELGIEALPQSYR